MICETLKTIDYDAIIINEPIKNSVLHPDKIRCR
jgi:hypothetical protein